MQRANLAGRCSGARLQYAALAAFALGLPFGGASVQAAAGAEAVAHRRAAPQPGPAGGIGPPRLAQALAAPPQIELPPLDADVMRAQRALHGPAWLGPHRAVPRSGPAGAPGGGDSLRGEWSAMPSGQLVWRLALRSPGALSMRVRFESFDVAGALWLHAGSGAAWAGPYTGRGPHGDGHFWSDVVFSDSVTVAYVPSGRAEAAAPPGFRIPLIAHELAPPRAPRARQAAPCHQDVTCHPGWKSA